MESIKMIILKEGKDKQNLIPISLGIGVNMWLNDNIGIGLQGDYLIMPYKHIANSCKEAFD